MRGLPWWLSGKESSCQCGRHGFDICKRYRATVNHTWQYVRKYFCPPPQKLATRLAEAVETRGGKVVFKIQPFVLFILIFVFLPHASCLSPWVTTVDPVCALELGSRNYWGHVQQLLKPTQLRACAPQQEKPPQREPTCCREGQPLLAAIREKPAHRWRPSTANMSRSIYIKKKGNSTRMCSSLHAAPTPTTQQTTSGGSSTKLKARNKTLSHFLMKIKLC